MDTTANTATDSSAATGFSDLVAVLGQQVRSTDEVEQRVRWLLELARALDSLPFDGFSELAEEARSAATHLIKCHVAFVAGRQR